MLHHQLVIVISIVMICVSCDAKNKSPELPTARVEASPSTSKPATTGSKEQTPKPQPSKFPPKIIRCGTKSCKEGEECIEYYGIAGASGPKMHSCGIPCTPGLKNGGCPSGMGCVTIADGPGPVCQKSIKHE